MYYPSQNGLNRQNTFAFKRKNPTQIKHTSLLSQSINQAPKSFPLLNGATKLCILVIRVKMLPNEKRTSLLRQNIHYYL